MNAILAPERPAPQIIDFAGVDVPDDWQPDHTLAKAGVVYDNLPDERYHRSRGIAKSGLDLVHRSPLTYITHRRHPKPSTPAMRLGSALHALVLTPEEFAAQYVRDPFPGSQAKAAKEARAALETEGKIIVPDAREPDFWSPGGWTQIHYMRDAVHADPIASALLGSGVAERSMYWIDSDRSGGRDATGKLCRGRIDFWSDAHELLVDLKSTADASFSAFAKSVIDRRYHVQDAYYSWGWWRATGKPATGFVFIAVEKEPPWQVACYVLGDGDRDLGRMLFERDLEVYRRCHDADEWPGYAPGEIRTLELPGWARRLPIF